MEVVFATEKLISFILFHLCIAGLSDCAIHVLFKKSFPMPMSLFFFPIRFSVPCFILGSLIFWGLSFVLGDTREPTWILSHIAIQLDQHHLFKILSLFSVYSLLLYQQLGIHKITTPDFILYWKALYQLSRVPRHQLQYLIL